MPHISVQGVSLRYPVYELADRRGVSLAAQESQSAGAPLLRASRGVSYVEALRGVSFEVGAGHRLGIVGVNGSGKSTLLRVLGGIYEPTSGRVAVRGRIAPLFNVGLGTRMESTGRQNIILRGVLRGLTLAQAKAQVDEIAEFSGLGRFIDMPMRTYSSGMVLRLCFAMATSFSPEVLLLDEWIGAGDPDFQVKARERMMALVGQAGITVIASHSRQLLSSVCDLGLWLDRGVMRAFGPIGEVYAAVDAAHAPTAPRPIDEAAEPRPRRIAGAA